MEVSREKRLEGEESWKLAVRIDWRVKRAGGQQGEESGGWRELKVSREKRLLGGESWRI